MFPETKKLQNALKLGLFTMILDFFLETAAVYFNWWYPKGGFQMPPLLIIPLEMVLSFFFIGASTGMILNLPEKIRNIDFKLFNWLKIFLKNPKYDLIWRILFILLTALIGTNGDYSAGSNIWAPRPYWHPIFTFIVW